MKKIFLFFTVILFVIFVISFLLSHMVLWQGVYPNNTDLTLEENKKIKAVLLDAVKDRCSLLYKLDSNEIYNPNSTEEIIQYETQADVSKSLFCLIDPNFMSMATRTKNGEYQVTIKVFYPESSYYCFKINEFDGQYLITSFQLDI